MCFESELWFFPGTIFLAKQSVLTPWIIVDGDDKQQRSEGRVGEQMTDHA